VRAKPHVGEQRTEEVIRAALGCLTRGPRATGVSAGVRSQPMQA
jgi:hypothetical protein